jgi:nucleotide-binding universal stress UspA family protein
MENDGSPAPFDRIIVGIGPEQRNPGLINTAAKVAERFGVPVELVSVVSRESDMLPEQRRFVMDAMANDHGLPDAECTTLTSWSVADALVEHVNEKGSPLLMVATSVRTRADDLLIGSTTGGVLHRISSPVLVLGPRFVDGSDPFTGPMVITVDGSDESESIFPLVQAWGRSPQQSRWVVTQIDGDLPLDVPHEQSGAHRIASRIGEDVEWEVLRGSDPGGAVVEFAAGRDAGLIVMATHGRSALGRAALGSTTMKVAHLAPCAVLTQRPPSVSVQSGDEPKGESGS